MNKVCQIGIFCAFAFFMWSVCFFVPFHQSDQIHFIYIDQNPNHISSVGFKNLYSEHNFDLSEEKVGILKQNKD